MKIDNATVRKIASLARIKISEDEADKMGAELNAVLGFVEQLQAVNTDGVEPMTAVIAPHLRGEQSLRADRINADALTGGNIRDQVLLNAPIAEHGFFAVPKVIE